MNKSLLASLLLAASAFSTSAAAVPHTATVYGSGIWGDRNTATILAVNQAIVVCQQSGGNVLLGFTVTSANFFHPNWYITAGISCQYL